MSRQQKEFHDGLIAQREKTAQMADASVAFITMKKQAGLMMNAAKAVGGMAMKHPGAAGAAVGAAGGAIAGGPNHRLSGAVAGGAIGGAAGHMAPKMLAKKPMGVGTRMVQQAEQGAHAAADAATAKEVKNLGHHAMGTAPTRQMNTPTPAAGPSAVPAGPTNTGAAIPYREGAPAVMGSPVPAGMAGGVAPKSSYKGMGPKDPYAGLVRNDIPPSLQGGPAAPNPLAKGTAPPTGSSSAKTEVLQKRASLPPFLVAADPSNAALSGGSSAVKTANALGELAASASEHPSSGFHLPGVGSLVSMIDDAAMIGRQKLQNSLNRRSEKKKEKIATEFNESPLYDMKQRAADKYPESVSPIEAIRTDFKSAVKLLSDKVHDLREARRDWAQPKLAMQSILQHEVPLNAGEFRTHREKIASEVGLDMKEMAQLGGMPKQLMTPRGAGFAGVGALIGGGMGYLGSRGKPEYGGRSRAEVDLDAAKAKQPEKPDGIAATIGKHVVNIHADVAEQMRKHPLAAIFAGAGVGAGLALRVSSLLGK